MGNSGTFKKGHIRSQESIEKQRETLRRQHRDGTRAPLRNLWTAKTRRKFADSTRGMKNWAALPFGSRRLHKATPNVIYWLVKVNNPIRWVYEHRYVFEQNIGRKLLRSEHIHHKNHDTLDNRIENLELLSHSEHSRLHGKNREILPDATLPPGVWSRKYSKCVHCNSTKFKHIAKGYCNSCYQKKFIRGTL